MQKVYWKIMLGNQKRHCHLFLNIIYVDKNKRNAHPKKLEIRNFLMLESSENKSIEII